MVSHVGYQIKTMSTHVYFFKNLPERYGTQFNFNPDKDK